MKKVLKISAGVFVAFAIALGVAFGFTSCNVTRVVTTESSYFQRGDTTCTITTKTVESYDATKKQ